MAKLYIVSTPIGNLEDITLRALRILKEVSLIAAEDTRTTGKLLSHFQIKTRMISYHEHNKFTRLDDIFEALTEGDVALVSDAGTPGLSDPGYELIRGAITQRIEVIPVPGASALLPALIASGLPTDSFIFAGFLPRKQSVRQQAIKDLAERCQTIVLYEAPHRLRETLSDLLTLLGNRQIAIARELTKLFEEFLRGDLQEMISHFQLTEPRGEFVIVIAGKSQEAEREWDTESLTNALTARIQAGESRSAAAKALAEESGWPRRDIYNLFTEDL